QAGRLEEAPARDPAGAVDRGEILLHVLCGVRSGPGHDSRPLGWEGCSVGARDQRAPGIIPGPRLASNTLPLPTGPLRAGRNSSPARRGGPVDAARPGPLRSRQITAPIRGPGPAMIGNDAHTPDER